MYIYLCSISVPTQAQCNSGPGHDIVHTLEIHTHENTKRQKQIEQHMTPENIHFVFGAHRCRQAELNWPLDLPKAKRK